MGSKGPYHWDDNKNKAVLIDRGRDLAEVCNLVFFTESSYWEVFENPYYPNQYRVIAKTQEAGFITIAMEDFSDNYGTFIKLITWWPSSKVEKRRFSHA